MGGVYGLADDDSSLAMLTAGSSYDYLVAFQITGSSDHDAWLVPKRSGEDGYESASAFWCFGILLHMVPFHTDIRGLCMMPVSVSCKCHEQAVLKYWHVQ